MYSRSRTRKPPVVLSFALEKLYTTGELTAVCCLLSLVSSLLVFAPFVLLGFQKQPEDTKTSTVEYLEHGSDENEKHKLWVGNLDYRLTE